MGSSDSDSQLVGLAARVNEETHAQRFGKSVGDSAEVLGEAFVDISRVGVEKGHLSCAGFCDSRIGVPYMADIVDQVKVAGSI